MLGSTSVGYDDWRFNVLCFSARHELPSKPRIRQWTEPLATFGHSFGVGSHRMMHFPRGFAQSILTIEEDTAALYLASASHTPDCERAARAGTTGVLRSVGRPSPA